MCYKIFAVCCYIRLPYLNFWSLVILILTFLCLWSVLECQSYISLAKQSIDKRFGTNIQVLKSSNLLYPHCISFYICTSRTGFTLHYQIHIFFRKWLTYKLKAYCQILYILTLYIFVYMQII